MNLSPLRLPAHRPPIRLLALLAGVLLSAATASAQNSYVSDGGGAITAYDKNFNLVQTFPQGTSSNVFGLAADAGGTLYALHHGSVDRFAPNGTYLGAFITANLTTAQGLAFDGAGNLYIADAKLNAIQKFASTGAFLGTFATGLNNPVGMAFDKAGILYVANDSGSNVQRFSAAGVSLGTFGSGLLFPGGLVFDAAGNLYVTNYDGGHGASGVKKFNAAGTLVQTFGAGLFNDPYGVAVTSAGNLYVTDYVAGSVLGFAPDGTSLLGRNGFVNPTAILFPAGVPEPSGWTLCLLAAAGWLGVRAFARRRVA